MSKLCEALLGDFLLPVVDPYMDPGQCGGFRGTSVTHYLIKLCDFIQKTLDSRLPHCAVLTSEDLSKAYNRGSHMLVVVQWSLSLTSHTKTNIKKLFHTSKIY